jgi:murein DD-endopeptidase MepM/ murein hydrolase activator NlpD
MVRITISGRATFRAERLEDRCAPAGLPWPVAAADIVGIAATYGQFDNRLYGPDREGWIHFHEGIDIEVTAGTGVVAVRAIEGGTVIGRDANGGFYDRISIATDTNHGWNYIHVNPTVE